MTRKSIPVHVVAYEKGYMYNFDIEKNHVLTFIDELKKRILIKPREKLVQYALFKVRGQTKNGFLRYMHYMLEFIFKLLYAKFLY